VVIMGYRRPREQDAISLIVVAAPMSSRQAGTILGVPR